MAEQNRTNYCFVLFAITLGLGLIVICLISLSCVGMVYRSLNQQSIEINEYLPLPDIGTDELINPAQNFEENSISHSEEFSTLDILNQTEIPINDPIDLAKRLGGMTDTPVIKSGMPTIYEIGQDRHFWKLNVDTNDYILINATLNYQTPHLYFWVEEGIKVNQTDLEKLANEFETKIYPCNREIFGNERFPGIDQDEHLTILFAKGLGGVGGYFSSTDTLPRQIETYSNEAEMFYLSADYTNLDEIFTRGVLAHEFQHMIQWNVDRNESAWMNEGLSELAVDLNGYNTGGFTFLFANDPDLQLNFWPGNDQGDSTPHYGASYLFLRYLYYRFGETLFRELVNSPLNGFDSIDAVYKVYSENTNSPLDSEHIFQDWSIANYIISKPGNGNTKKYRDMPLFPIFNPTETLDCANTEWQQRTVNQFGADYIKIECRGNYQIEIKSDSSINLLPTSPYSGDFYFWSNYGDESEMKLSKTFDFSEITGPIFLSYWTWYDIEKDYDYLYLTASEDGENWDILKTPSCTEKNPTGANYGCGLNGKSDGWINETIDLSQYAGKKVTLQFEYITDMAVNGDGFLIDDISITASNYFSDFEKDQGGWKGEGFVRIKNTLRQSFGLTRIDENSGELEEKIINSDGLDYLWSENKPQIQMNQIIIISGLTRFTHQPATYYIKLSKIN